MRRGAAPVVLLVWSVLQAIPAGAGETSVYQVEGKEVRLLDFPAEHLTLSESCRSGRAGDSPPRFHCRAHEAFLKAGRGAWKVRRQGAGNLGARVCRENLQAEIVMGEDAAGNENSFCRFGDGSLLDNGSLAFAVNAAAKRK